MGILARFSKQATEVLDYYVDYGEWFEDRADSPLSYVVVADAGITVAQTSMSGAVVRVVLSGGDNGARYKVTVRMTTSSTPAIVKEADFTVTIKDS